MLPHARESWYAQLLHEKHNSQHNLADIPLGVFDDRQTQSQTCHVVVNSIRIE